MQVWPLQASIQIVKIHLIRFLQYCIIQYCKNQIGWILTWALVGMVQHFMGKIPKQVQ